MVRLRFVGSVLAARRFRAPASILQRRVTFERTRPLFLSPTLHAHSPLYHRLGSRHHVQSYQREGYAAHPDDVHAPVGPVVHAANGAYDEACAGTSSKLALCCLETDADLEQKEEQAGKQLPHGEQIWRDG